MGYVQYLKWIIILASSVLPWWKWSWLSQPWPFLIVDPWHLSFTSIKATTYWFSFVSAQVLLRAATEPRELSVLQTDSLSDRRATSDTSRTHYFLMREAETNRFLHISDSNNSAVHKGLRCMVGERVGRTLHNYSHRFHVYKTICGLMRFCPHRLDSTSHRFASLERTGVMLITDSLSVKATAAWKKNTLPIQ